MQQEPATPDGAEHELVVDLDPPIVERLRATLVLMIAERNDSLDRLRGAMRGLVSRDDLKGVPQAMLSDLGVYARRASDDAAVLAVLRALLEQLDDLTAQATA